VVLTRQLTVNVVGQGAVSSATTSVRATLRSSGPPEIKGCRKTCSASLPKGTRVRLIATADQYWSFDGWTGCAPATSGPKNACTFQLDVARDIEARFTHTNRKPTVRITSPVDNARIDTNPRVDPVTDARYQDVQLDATARDPDGDPLTYRWTDKRAGEPARAIASLRSPIRRLSSPYPACATGSGDPHTLRLEVSDGDRSATDSVVVYLRCVLF
jgi:hypothetical protein